MLLPDDQSVTFIQSISFITISSTVITIASDEQARTTVIPVKTQTLASLVPYIASGSSTPSPKSSFPVTPIAAAVAGVVVIAVSAALYVFFRRRSRRRRMTVPRDANIEAALSDPPPDLPPPGASVAGSRTFSRLTFSAPYVVPLSPGSPSTAAPSTVSIGQQYRTAHALLQDKWKGAWMK